MLTLPGFHRRRRRCSENAPVVLCRRRREWVFGQRHTSTKALDCILIRSTPTIRNSHGARESLPKRQGVSQASSKPAVSSQATFAEAALRQEQPAAPCLLRRDQISTNLNMPVAKCVELRRGKITRGASNIIVGWQHSCYYRWIAFNRVTALTRVTAS